MDWKKLFERRNIWLLLLAAVQMVFLGGRFVKDFRTGPALEVPPKLLEPPQKHAQLGRQEEDYQERASRDYRQKAPFYFLFPVGCR